jgi:CBS domain containing-hemolysin-like protein
MDDPFSPWGLLALVMLLGLNALFVAAEYARVSGRRTRIDELSRLTVAHPHSQYPVYEDDLDPVAGIAHLKDIVRVQNDPRRHINTVRGLMREAVFAPDTLRLDRLLRLMQAKKQQLVIVLDEYGGTAGRVGLDDILTETVGEVRGPFDPTSPEVQTLPDGSALIAGLMRIEDVNGRFGLNLQAENDDTIAGFILGRLGRMASVGDTLEAGGVKLRVESLDGRRIARVLLKNAQPEQTCGPTPPVRDAAAVTPLASLPRWGERGAGPREQAAGHPVPECGGERGRAEVTDAKRPPPAS